MSGRLYDKAERRLGIEGLAQRIADAPAADQTAIWLEVARLVAERRSPAVVLARYIEDEYVRPSTLDLRALRNLEVALLDAAPAFDAIELSPLAPLGAVSAIAVGSQNRILPAARGLEIDADPTNVLALECASRRRAGERRELRLCTLARLVRTQKFDDPGFSRHFSMLAFVVAARHVDGRELARDVVREHVEVQRRIFGVLQDLGSNANAFRVELHVSDDYRSVAEELAPKLEATVHPLEGAYYAGLRFKVFMRFGETEVPIGDGGAVDWLRKLLSDRKEHLITSAFGIEASLKLGFPSPE
jgi:hypothetical protein